jgi:hypothetical protein
MGYHTIQDTDIRYGLIAFDADGAERLEADGNFTQKLIEDATSQEITNVFFFCHGWKGDEPAAKDQYGKWIKAFAASADQERASQVFPSFRPMYVGLHWPSLPFGDEELRGGSYGTAGGTSGPEVLLQAYLTRLGDRPGIRGPLKVIFNEARRNASPDELPQHVRAAYLELNDALGLKSEGVDGGPDADREEFDPEDSYEAGNDEGSVFGGDMNLGGILGPLRQLSYWTMKQRARTVGEGGMHDFLNDLQLATKQQKTRIHLMGHSFGSIVVSGMLGGRSAKGNLLRPVDSVALVQGAVSLWCYAPDIPFRVLLRKAGPGYFSRILADQKVIGPVVTTRSIHDRAVSVLYPLASRIKGSPEFAGKLPKYGAIGAHGIQGLPDNVRSELTMLGAAGRYSFEPGKVYNLDGSQFICHMDGASGAHSDIAGPEVAHAIWAAAFASVPATAAE